MESVSKKSLDRISEIATLAASTLGILVLRITARGTGSRPIVEVTLDGSRLIAITDCETVNRKLNEMIEAESLLPGNFRIDVLSPGLDEPIVHDYQLERTLGHLVEVKYHADEKEISTLGKLGSYSPSSLSILKRQSRKGTEAVQIEIERAKITKIYARPDFG
ncbi:MAG: hypothetical protein WCH46_05765 [bacterium]